MSKFFTTEKIKIKKKKKTYTYRVFRLLNSFINISIEEGYFGWNNIDIKIHIKKGFD